MISRDDGFRCAWRNFHLIVLVFVLSFICMSAIGYFWELFERFMQ